MERVGENFVSLLGHCGSQKTSVREIIFCSFWVYKVSQQPATSKLLRRYELNDAQLHRGSKSFGCVPSWECAFIQSFFPNSRCRYRARSLPYFGGEPDHADSLFAAPALGVTGNVMLPAFSFLKWRWRYWPHVNGYVPGILLFVSGQSYLWLLSFLWYIHLRRTYNSPSESDLFNCLRITIE